MTISTVELEALYSLMGINILWSGFAGFFGAFNFSHLKIVFQQERIDSLPVQERKLAQEIHDKKYCEMYSPKFMPVICAISLLFFISIGELM